MWTSVESINMTKVILPWLLIVFCIQSLTLHNFMELEKATLYIYNKTTYDKYTIVKKIETSIICH